ncbi:type II secretion system protein GspL [Caenimonas sp. SL110]|uniref:type II secretion system protein GspL n=1 Tax=Caenimonas sp. SL110 TaxID=1450524 RepID=UPI0006545CEE|nr:type II secretion system protein GspL [Caenimonas sp. SL110]
MSALVVFLPTHPVTASTEFDFAVTTDGTTVSDHGTAAAALLPSATRAGVEVVALVPASMLSWHRVDLPKGVAAAPQRLRAVLEGLLEDQLLDEPEALHFALQPQSRGTGPQWVATCDRVWLRAAVHALEAAGRPATRIVPEFAPEGEPALYALGDPEQPMLVVAGDDGVTTLPLSSQALGLLPSLPEGTPCIAEPAVAAIAEQVLQRQPVLRHPAERWLQSARSSWDLAQLEFSSSGRARAIKKLGTAWADLLAAPQWKPARWGAILVVVINLVGLNAWAWRERSALDDKRVAIRTTLTSTFPQVKTVVDAPLQMEREVATLRQATGATSGSDMEAMLGLLSTAVPAQTTLTGLEFANGELRAKGLAAPPADAASIVANLKSQGYTAAMQGDTLVMSLGAVR